MTRQAVLLLGGEGFIGSALAQALRQQGETVYVVGRHNRGHLEDWLPLCGTVLHLASGSTPGSSARNPGLEAANIALTLRLLELLQAYPSVHLIYFSSGGTVYGNPAQIPVDEDSTIAPLSFYGAGKAAQEAFCQAARGRGLAVTIVRPSNAYGPGQSLRQGFGLVRTMLEHARQGTQPEIWGDGEAVRDYIFIDDLVQATLGLVRLPHDSGTYNLGSGVGHSINQVRALVEQACGMALPASYRAARGQDVRSVVLDQSRLSRLLGWQPGVDLQTGIARCWAALQQP